jgi:hypothetical protein
MVRSDFWVSVAASLRLTELAEPMKICAAGVTAILLSSCAQQYDVFSSSFYRKLTSPQAEQAEYMEAIDAYKRCIATKPLEACESERQIMEAMAAGQPDTVVAEQ